MRLYVANGTKQIVGFYYSVKNESGIGPQLQQRGPLAINPGAQIELPEELSRTAVDHVVLIQSRFGFVRHDEMDRLFVKGHIVPMVYAIDMPVPAEAITRLIRHNETVLALRGQQTRIEAGLAFARQAEETVTQMQPNSRHQIRNVSMTMEEFGRDRNDTSPEFSEQVVVSNDTSKFPDGKPVVLPRAH